MKRRIFEPEWEIVAIGCDQCCPIFISKFPLFDVAGPRVIGYEYVTLINGRYEYW